MRCEHKICGNTEKVWLPFEVRGHTKGLKPHPYCIHCGTVMNVSADRAKPLGYYINILSNLPITKVQIRLIVKELENIGDFDDIFSTSRFVQEQLFSNAINKYSNITECVIKSALQHHY